MLSWVGVFRALDTNVGVSGFSGLSPPNVKSYVTRTFFDTPFFITFADKYGNTRLARFIVSLSLVRPLLRNMFHRGSAFQPRQRVNNSLETVAVVLTLYVCISQAGERIVMQKKDSSGGENIYKECIRVIAWIPTITPYRQGYPTSPPRSSSRPHEHQHQQT